MYLPITTPLLHDMLKFRTSTTKLNRQILNILGSFSSFNSRHRLTCNCWAHLLHLELDGGLDLVHLGNEVLVGEQGGELASLVQPRAQDTRDLLDKETQRPGRHRTSWLEDKSIK